MKSAFRFPEVKKPASFYLAFSPSSAFGIYILFFPPLLSLSSHPHIPFSLTSLDRHRRNQQGRLGKAPFTLYAS